MSKFTFGDIVVVGGNLVGVVVKCWQRIRDDSYHYDVYVRSFNSICEYEEPQIERFVYDKEIPDREDI